MPENAYGRGHLWSHLASSTKSNSAAAIRRKHPDWPECENGCGWPVNPAALVGGFTTHPTCGKGRTSK